MSLLVLAWCSAWATQPASGSLCEATQAIYFSCQTARHQTISLCGALPSALQYRYGKAGKVELAFPDDVAHGARQFAFAHYSRYQVERSEISFSHGDAGYTLFDYTEDGRRTAGVQVSTAEGKAAEIHCVGVIQGTLSPLGKSLRCDTDSALNGGRCP
ncbi:MULTISPECIES: hypothetical protein [Rhodanobacter]|uniref:hypothetical protein n=1 Tax=Rhodanobacter TaxID=75309 RepID=UPI00040B9171|nr:MULTISPECIES: hypothetical protein [Rhodanobacter]TAN16933.1 MAG: hypothetical protein EPN35_08525 [Rhodanobacter sp.]UJJ53684.1 hypothetical protein LRK53_11905 [Rhodanobacter thiooxydans]